MMISTARGLHTVCCCVSGSDSLNTPHVKVSVVLKQLKRKESCLNHTRDPSSILGVPLKPTLNQIRDAGLSGRVFQP